ncbi:energy-coupling factor transporter transmembrane component T [Nocardia arthritidis]|uniref:energy-coupling factor transporter transmembrane component T n=1 Tax=Nocardia arthritidis TaxID=228602 RepID=UPI001EEA8EF9|nr:energy-coupling factor transporter transmembrane component T [Nocardia arthritidis]
MTSRTSRWELDPRVALALLLAASVALMSPGGTRFVPAALITGVLLAFSARAWRRAAGLVGTVAVTAAVAYLSRAAAWPVLGLVSVTAGYGLRLLAVGGIAVHLIRTIPPTRLTAALRSARVPMAFTVSGAVLLRFVPAIVGEARAVRAAMRLRGLGGWWMMLRHPMLSVEFFTVPLIASSLRAAEDLSASALLRGLGSHPRPTSMRPLRLGPVDVAAAMVFAMLVAATLCWETGR